MYALAAPPSCRSQEAYRTGYDQTSDGYIAWQRPGFHPHAGRQLKAGALNREFW